MSTEIPIRLAVEDELGEHILRVLLGHSKRNYIVCEVYGKQGFGFLKKNLPAFNSAARGSAHLILTDLDRRPCAANLIEEWFNCSVVQYPSHRHRNLIFRIAVREVESWIIADRERFAHFLGISNTLIPKNPDGVADPKALLLDLAVGSRKRDLREDLVREISGIKKRGPDYNGRLAAFLNSSWRVSSARKASPSLERTCQVLDSFLPLHIQVHEN